MGRGSIFGIVDGVVGDKRKEVEAQRSLRVVSGLIANIVAPTATPKVATIFVSPLETYLEWLLGPPG
jgi:hypothetical protein